jgi:zinc protease
MARALESLGAPHEEAAGRDAANVKGELLIVELPRGLELLRMVLREPTFAKDEVRRQRDEQLAQLVAELEDPSSVAEKCVASFLYGAYSYGRPQDGLPKTVADLGRGDVRDFYGKWYAPNNTILVLVGDVTASDAVARVREAFGSWPARADAVPERAGPPSAVTARRVLLVDKKDATQTQIRAGAIAMKRNDPNLLPAQVANTILGGGFSSKLVEELRVKRSLTYSAQSGYVARLTGGDFRVSTFTKSPTTVETLSLALDVEGQFRQSTPDPKMLAKAKAYLTGQFPLRVETPDALASRLAEIEFFGLPKDDLETYRTRVEAVTPADAEAVSSKYMPPPDQMAIVVVGKADEVRGPLEAKYGPVQVTTPEACGLPPAR